MAGTDGICLELIKYRGIKLLNRIIWTGKTNLGGGKNT